MNIPDVLLIKDEFDIVMNRVINYSIEELEKIHKGYKAIYKYPKDTHFIDGFIAYRIQGLIIYYNKDHEIITIELFNKVGDINFNHKFAITTITTKSNLSWLSIEGLLRIYIHKILEYHNESRGQIPNRG